MPLKSKVDLCGITWPVCLLKFKNALKDLGAYDVLDVFTRDPDVVDNITMIVDRSEDRLITQHEEGEVYRLSIQKG